MTDAFSTTMTTEGVTAVRTWPPPESEGPVVDSAVGPRPTDRDELYEMGVLRNQECPKDMRGCVVQELENRCGRREEHATSSKH
jgi:hypothetical protein